jgi:hypothetical protein
MNESMDTILISRIDFGITNYNVLSLFASQVSQCALASSQVTGCSITV